MQNNIIINKIAFLVHEPTLFIHYCGVWANLKSDFVILLLHRCEQGKSASSPPDVKAFINRINQLGYEFGYYSDAVSQGEMYRYVVSNHCIGEAREKGLKRLKSKLVKSIGKRTGRIGKNLLEKYGESRLIIYEPMQVGVKQIRFMYGADVGDGWSLQKWNSMYDLFLCHGPNDEKAIKRRFDGKTEQMGYPRYDDYFRAKPEDGELRQEFKLDPNKKTILWMATTGKGVCSIPDFASPLVYLMADYNVIIRPHPISFRSEPEYIKLLESLNYSIDGNAIRDMNKLYSIVDFVICDFGGSAFGAIYLDKKLILLDVKGSDTAFTSVNSSNFELHEYFPVVKADQAESIKHLLVDEILWNRQKKSRQTLFSKYFYNNRGASSARAAELLDNLGQILK